MIGNYKSERHSLNSLPALGKEFFMFLVTKHAMEYITYIIYIRHSLASWKNLISIYFGVRCGQVTCLANEMWQKLICHLQGDV